MTVLGGGPSRLVLHCWVLCSFWRVRNEEGSALQQQVQGAHLLKVGNVPLLIDGVAVEATANVIVHAACRHLLQRRLRHRQRVLPPPCRRPRIGPRTLSS